MMTKKDIKDVIDTISPIGSLFDYSPVEEMKEALEKHINPNADDSDSSAGTSIDFSKGGASTKADKVSAEEDNTNDKINDAFDKLLN